MPRMVFPGTVVDKDIFEYERTRGGVQERAKQYQLFIRSEGDDRGSAQVVICQAEQYGGFAKGDVVEIPVDVEVRQPFNVGGRAKLRVSLDESYDVMSAGKGSKLSAVAAHAASGS